MVERSCSVGGMVKIWSALIILMVVGSGKSAERVLVEFLKWEHRARVERAVHTEFGEVTCGGETKAAIFQHAGGSGAGATSVVFSGVEVPEIGGGVKTVGMVFLLGMKDGEAFRTAEGVDGVGYAVAVDGRVVFSEEYPGAEMGGEAGGSYGVRGGDGGDLAIGGPIEDECGGLVGVGGAPDGGGG